MPLPSAPGDHQRANAQALVAAGAARLVEDDGFDGARLAALLEELLATPGTRHELDPATREHLIRAALGLSSAQAQRIFAKAIDEKDDFAVPRFNIAVLYEERGEVEPAVANYEKAIDLAPKYYEAQFNLGRLVGYLGQVDRQQELWEASIESNPDFVQGYFYLSKLLMDRGRDLGRAEELVRLGIEKDPDHEEGPLGYYVLADIFNRTGRAAEAREAVAAGQRIQAEMK